MSNKTRIYDELVALSIKLGQKQPDIRLKMFIEDLKDFDIDLVIMAIKKCGRELKFFPQIADIIQAMKPPEISQEGLINEISGLIFSEIKNINPYDPYSNPVISKYRAIIERMNGVNYLCSLDESEAGNTLSRIKGAVKSWIERGELNNKLENHKRLETKNTLEKIEFRL